MVSNREDWQRLRQALADTSTAFNEAVPAHKERSQINKENEGWFGIDIVRNLIELAGEGDEDYPAMEQWEEPKALIAAGHLADGEGHSSRRWCRSWRWPSWPRPRPPTGCGRTRTGWRAARGSGSSGWAG